MCKKIAKDLLENELKHNLSQERATANKLKYLQDCLRNTISLIDFARFIEQTNSTNIQHMNEKHNRKLFKLWLKDKKFSLDSKQPFSTIQIVPYLMPKLKPLRTAGNLRFSFKKWTIVDSPSFSKIVQWYKERTNL